MLIVSKSRTDKALFYEYIRRVKGVKLKAESSLKVKRAP